MTESLNAEFYVVRLVAFTVRRSELVVYEFLRASRTVDQIDDTL